MNNSTSNEKTSKPSKSIKQSDRAEAQLGLRKEAKSERTSETVTIPVPEREIIPASTLPPVEKVAFLPVETVKPAEIADEPESRANHRMMSKLRRAFRKAGKPDTPEAEMSAFLTSLLETKVPVLNRSSGRIARVVKGEQNIESLLLARVPTKSE